MTSGLAYFTSVMDALTTCILLLATLLMSVTLTMRLKLMRHMNRASLKVRVGLRRLFLMLSAITWVLLFLLFLLILFLNLLLLLSLRQFRMILREKQEVETAQIAVVSKALALLSSKDAITYQAIQVMDSQTLTSDESGIEESIDSLLERAERSDPSLTEADYERIDRANFGPTAVGTGVR